MRFPFIDVAVFLAVAPASPLTIKGQESGMKILPPERIIDGLVEPARPIESRQHTHVRDQMNGGCEYHSGGSILESAYEMDVVGLARRAGE